MSLCISLSYFPSVTLSFSIDQNSGDISVTSPLDREILANYKLTIRASDGGTPKLSSSKSVKVKILDVNDNAPIFTSRLYSGRISEDAAVGSRIVQVGEEWRLLCCHKRQCWGMSVRGNGRNI